MLNNKLREQSIKNIYSQRQKYNRTTAGFKLRQHNSKSRSIDKDISAEKAKEKEQKESRLKDFDLKNKDNTIEERLQQK